MFDGGYKGCPLMVADIDYRSTGRGGDLAREGVGKLSVPQRLDGYEDILIVAVDTWARALRTGRQRRRDGEGSQRNTEHHHTEGSKRYAHG